MEQNNYTKESIYKILLQRLLRAAKKAFEKTKADAQKRYARLKALEAQQ